MSTCHMSSRERVLAAMRREDVDYVPCSPGFNPLTEVQRRGYRWQIPWGPSLREEIESLLELGVDPIITMPLGGNYPAEGVTSRVWVDGDIIHKAYTTPAGVLHSAVRDDGKWPFGLDIPFYNDFVAHYVEPWITCAQDVECLKYLYGVPHTPEQVAELRYAYDQHQALADEYQLATRTWIGTGLTGALQLCGSAQICMMTVDEPELVDALLEVEHQFNVNRIAFALDWGVDIILRNGFYESSDFYSPSMLNQYLGKRLAKEIATTHQGGAVFCYLLHTGVPPMLDYLTTLDFDCLTYLDIAFQQIDLGEVNAKLGTKKSFWTGPSNTFHMWADDPAVVREAVRTAFSAFGKQGLIIAACPSVHSITPWENFLAMIDEWKRLR